MKVYLCYWILICWQLCACHNDAPQSSGKQITQDTLKEISSSAKLVELNYPKSTLPFVDSMVNLDTTKILPPIDSATYLKLNTGFDFNFKDGKKLQYLKSFNNRLPDINKYQLYYLEFNCPKVKDSVALEICDNFVNLSCGFLIFYEAKKKYAQIVNVMNSYYIDAAVDMNFLIDEDHTIHLEETGMTDGDVGPDEAMESISYAMSKHVINVDENGVIHCKQIEGQ